MVHCLDCLYWEECDLLEEINHNIGVKKRVRLLKKIPDFCKFYEEEENDK